MTLDDLGRAVWESAPKALNSSDTPWGELDEESQALANVFALAAMERFAEEVCKMWCAMCKDGHEPRFDAEHCRWYHPGTTFCNAEDVRQLLASLRAEAGQKSNAAQPQKGIDNE